MTSGHDYHAVRIVSYNLAFIDQDAQKKYRSNQILIFCYILCRKFPLIPLLAPDFSPHLSSQGGEGGRNLYYGQLSGFALKDLSLSW